MAVCGGGGEYSVISAVVSAPHPCFVAVVGKLVFSVSPGFFDHGESYCAEHSLTAGAAVGEC